MSVTFARPNLHRHAGGVSEAAPASLGAAPLARRSLGWRFKGLQVEGAWLIPLGVAALSVVAAFTAAAQSPAADPRIAELDAFWGEVARTVREGDFDAYAVCYHPDGVLVSEKKGRTEPIAAALARWKPEFSDTRTGNMKAEVETRFTRRLGDTTTAHEAGIFRYTAHVAGQQPRTDYVPFEALLVKRDGRWLMLMEYQKAHVTQAEWDALAK